MKYLIIYLWICLLAHFGGDVFYLRSDEKLYKNGWDPDYTYTPKEAFLDVLLAITPLGLVANVAMIKTIFIARKHTCEELSGKIVVRSFLSHFTFRHGEGLI